ncbi:MAG: hypothetical protein A2X86_15820 [Bdellovibrionales bacterium GWA2_49_15]|nr:MAG: hypothetical protein A2X86_15820 [Bdellovibrionales bacterium GWA2_49_15]HAZ12404.1 acyl-CoA dehydrogenase [Bdellovibrionales bacterium]
MKSVAAGLFYGEVEESSVFPYPGFTEEQKSLAIEMTDAVKKYATANIDAAKFDLEETIPAEVLQGFAEMGLFGMAVKEEFGGLGLDYHLYARVFSELAGFDGATTTTLGAHQSIGYRALINEGNPEQQKKWLPKLASGEWIAAFCLTEPGAGSDAYSIKTKATKNADGTYTINGQKLWITNGGMAHFYTVFCKTEHEIKGEKQERITCFVVTKDMPGVSFGNKEHKMGIRASETRAVFLDKVVVPADNIIGEPGKGFKIAMNVLNSGRLSLGAGTVGGMRTVLKWVSQHAATRKQFDRPIAEFGLVQEKLATMTSLIYATESIVYMTSGNMNRGMNEYFIESAICKVFGSECLWKVVDMGLQIAAGIGYMREYPYERMMRDSRINLIFEGTNEILRVFIALSGIKGPSDSLKSLGKLSDVSSALTDPIKSLGVLTDFAKNRLSHMMGGRALSQYHPSLRDQSEMFSAMLGEFAIHVENTLFKYGKHIIGNELPQGRLANMVIELYVMLAVLSRTTFILNKSEVPEQTKAYVTDLATMSFTDSRRRFQATSRLMTRHLDEETKRIAKKLCEQEGYGLDTMYF